MKLHDQKEFLMNWKIQRNWNLENIVSKQTIRIIFFFWKIWKLFFNGIRYYMYIEIENVKVNYMIFFQLKIIFDE